MPRINMYQITNTKQYKKDAKAMAKQGKDRQKLVTVLELLAKGIPLDEQYKDHSLINNWKGHRECHIEPDWLLIYKIDKKNNRLHLVRTGSHTELLECLTVPQLNEKLKDILK